MSELLVTLHTVPPGRTVRELELNRPTRRNALNLRLLEALLTQLDGPEPEALLLTGHGPAFCSGLDLDECRRVSTWPVRLRHLELLEQVYSRLLRSSALTIALVRGFAVGGGAGLAACADWVIATTDSCFRIPQGELFKLARVVLPITGARQAASGKVSAWLAGEIDAPSALACGIVDELVEPAAWVRRLAELRASPFVWPDGQSSWRTPALCQRVLTEMQEVIASME